VHELGNILFQYSLSPPNVIPKSGMSEFWNFSMFADAIAFVCYCDAGRVLSPIAKFLVRLLVEGRGRVKWEGVEVREESGRGRGVYGGTGNENAR